ncbi:MAG: dephospho-CoA kinase [Sedimentibacter sp.]|uniref:dephospho-CoA kinase n=1 Tax=Sedimentibacter sp. TaxID=1960295 RepID=UPI0029814CDA|nr:dephospho-CoA kinase [Sedimentibacter sp.]MDW5299284.1 dephospho-CoA kinase [Sedimentibacter sp.]
MKLNKIPKIIVITGSIGTGKSTAVNIIKEMGFKVLDSDKIVHEGYNIGNTLYNKVVKHFGKEILNKDNTIDRQKLGQIVFNDKVKLIFLNNLVHNSVVEELIKGINECEDEVIFLDIPLILEVKEKNEFYDLKFDEIWLIYVNEQTQRERLWKRAIIENKNPDDVLKIISKQISIEEKVSMVDEVINNEGTVEELEQKIQELLKTKGIRW